MEEELKQQVAFNEAGDDGEQTVYNDEQLSMNLFKVRSKMSSDRIKIKIKDDDGMTKEVWVEVPSQYPELLNEDLTTAFQDQTQRAVTEHLAMLYDQVKSFGINNKIDMVESACKFANRHNYRVNSSKSGGQGANIAKSHFVKTSSQKSIDMSGVSKKQGFFAKLFGGGR